MGRYKKNYFMSSFNPSFFSYCDPPSSTKMAAKGIFVFVSLCLFAFAFGKPQSQVIMLIMSHNCYSCLTEASRKEADNHMLAL